MATKKAKKKPGSKALGAKKAAASKAFGAKKALTHAFTVGPGAALVQFRRSGTARQGLRASIQGTAVQWQPDDRSVPIPMGSGVHKVAVGVQGPSGSWMIRVVAPSGATGGTQGTLPPDSQATFNLLVP